jgi:hypothetical protein
MMGSDAIKTKMEYILEEIRRESERVILFIQGGFVSNSVDLWIKNWMGRSRSWESPLSPISIMSSPFLESAETREEHGY